MSEKKMVEMWNQHPLQKTCPRCGGWDVGPAIKDKVEGPHIRLIRGIKYIRYACRECRLLFEEAD